MGTQKENENPIGGGIVAALIIAVSIFASAWLVGGNQSASFGGSSDSGWNATGDGCISVDGTCIIDASGNLDGVITSSTGSFSGLLTLNAGTLHSYPNSTSTTATTQTLVQADILNYDTILLTPNTGDLTLTWPATSTLTSLVPTAGDTAKQCMHNASTTSGIDITIAAGTGIDLMTASSSILGGAPVLTILSNQVGCFTYIRQTDTDISMLFERFVNGD